MRLRERAEAEEFDRSRGKEEELFWEKSATVWREKRTTLLLEGDSHINEWIVNCLNGTVKNFNQLVFSVFR